MKQMTTSELIAKLASPTADRAAILAVLRVSATVVPVSALTADERIDRIFDLND